MILDGVSKIPDSSAVIGSTAFLMLAKD